MACPMDTFIHHTYRLLSGTLLLLFITIRDNKKINGLIKEMKFGLSEIKIVCLKEKEKKNSYSLLKTDLIIFIFFGNNILFFSLQIPLLEK
jgi:hypothetical protein